MSWHIRLGDYYLQGAAGWVTRSMPSVANRYEDAEIDRELKTVQKHYPMATKERAKRARR